MIWPALDHNFGPVNRGGSKHEVEPTFELISLAWLCVSEIGYEDIDGMLVEPFRRHTASRVLKSCSGGRRAIHREDVFQAVPGITHGFVTTGEGPVGAKSLRRRRWVPFGVNIEYSFVEGAHGFGCRSGRYRWDV